MAQEINEWNIAIKKKKKKKRKKKKKKKERTFRDREGSFCDRPYENHINLSDRLISTAELKQNKSFRHYIEHT